MDQIGAHINDTVLVARLAAAIWECTRHAAELTAALLDWPAGMPLSIEALDHDATVRRLTDQILC